MDGFKNKASRFVEDIKEDASEIIEDIAESAADAVDDLKEKASELADEIKNKASEVNDNFQEKTAEMAEDVKDQASELVATASATALVWRGRLALAWRNLKEEAAANQSWLWGAAVLLVLSILLLYTEPVTITIG